MRIVKTFFNKHIDLDYVVAISDAYITSIPSLLSSHPAVEFTIDIALRDAPIKYTRLLTEEEYQDGDDYACSGIVLANGSPDAGYFYRETRALTLAEVNLQAQIDELIREWKNKT